MFTLNRCGKYKIAMISFFSRCSRLGENDSENELFSIDVSVEWLCCFIVQWMKNVNVSKISNLRVQQSLSRRPKRLGILQWQERATKCWVSAAFHLNDIIIQHDILIFICLSLFLSHQKIMKTILNPRNILKFTKNLLVILLLNVCWKHNH